MADNKPPAYQWYPRDFNADEPVQLMTLEAEGAYRRLLDHQWLHGSIPPDVKELAKLCKNTSVAKMKRIWKEVGCCFTEIDGDVARLQNRRLERVREDSDAFRERQSRKGKAGARARWEDKPEDSTGINTGNPPGTERLMPADGSAPAPSPASASITEQSDAREKTSVTDIADDLHVRLACTALGEHWEEVSAFIRTRSMSTHSAWAQQICKLLGGGSKYIPEDIAGACTDCRALETPISGPHALRAFVEKRYKERTTSVEVRGEKGEVRKFAPRFTRDFEAEGAAVWSTIVGSIIEVYVKEESGGGYYVKKIKDDVMSSLNNHAIEVLQSLGGPTRIATSKHEALSHLGNQFSKAYAGKCNLSATSAAA